jgi:penicillin-binding protein 1C
MWKSRFVRWLTAIPLAAFLVFLLLHILFPLRISVSYSQIITDRHGEVLHAFLSSDEKWRMKTELNEITPLLRKTIIQKEDRYFYYHPGINPVAIVRAAMNNGRQSRKTSGASTITMQVARLLDPKPRTYAGKLEEMFRALQLEWRFSKQEILQLYLNLVPYGGNIEGVKSASLIYFGQTPQHLSLAQIVTLAIIPNRPSSLVIGKNNERIIQERNRWLNRLLNEGIFTKEKIDDALGEKLSAQRQAVPRLAPHLSWRLAGYYPQQPIIYSTLDLVKQEKVENIAYNYIRRIHYRGITNCAVMVMNNETCEVEAYLGSADFFSSSDHGQVDGVRAVRSPGSTLKPLLYALAIDRGLATPQSILLDVPVNYSGYRPVNFDQYHRGPVTLETALANSLNVPAVKMLDALGTSSFFSALKNSGFATIAIKEKQLGLSAILGGCGVTLEELVRLYASFAREGRAEKILFTIPSAEKKSSTRIPASSEVQMQLFSPAAAFLITNMLTQHDRPDLPTAYQSSFRLPKIAWKTGTSYGRRDAWSIGYNKEFTIGVWVGNMNGAGINELTGAEVATPLLFEIFNSVAYNTSAAWLTEPASLDMRWVCSVTGKIPESFCTDQVMDYYLPGISSTASCDHRKELFVSADGEMAYCRNCLPESGYRKNFYPNLSGELIAYYQSQAIPYEQLPPHNPQCTRLYTSQAPAITSLTGGLEYILENRDGQIALTCNADNEVNEVYWYVNDQFYRAAGVHERLFFTPQPGDVKISCADDKGRHTHVMVKVTYLE